MICKLLSLAAVVVVAQAGVVGPVATKLVETEFDPAPQYTYAYDVQDALTGDSKNQFETRNGDIVQGRYSLIEADGTRRVVDYTADPINGFNAVVQREPAVVRAIAKVAAPVVAAPARVLAAAPYVSPVAPYVAPVSPYVSPAAPYLSAPAHLAAPVTKFASAPLFASAPFARLAAPGALSAYTALY